MKLTLNVEQHVFVKVSQDLKFLDILLFVHGVCQLLFGWVDHFHDVCCLVTLRQFSNMHQNVYFISIKHYINALMF